MNNEINSLSGSGSILPSSNRESSGEIEQNVPTTLGDAVEGSGATPLEDKSKLKDTSAAKMANMFDTTRKGAGTAVGVPLAVLGKAAGGLIGGAVGLSAGIAGTLGAGMGWIASGVTGGNKYERKEAAMKGAGAGAIPTAIAVGALLTPINVAIKFVENFGKALIPEDVKKSDVYKKFDDTYKTNVFPFFMTVGKKAVEEQRKEGFDLDRTAIFKAHDKLAGKPRQSTRPSEQERDALLNEYERTVNKDKNEIDEILNDYEPGSNEVIPGWVNEDPEDLLKALDEQEGKNTNAAREKEPRRTTPEIDKDIDDLFKELDSKSQSVDSNRPKTSESTEEDIDQLLKDLSTKKPPPSTNKSDEGKV